MKKKILTTTLIAAIAIGTAVTASANWGQRGGGYWNDDMQAPGPRMQMQYQQLDPAVKEKLDKFITDTQDIRKEMAVKRAEQRAFLRSDNPDSEAAGKLAGELFDLRTTMQQKAEEAGVTAYVGPRGPQGGRDFGPRGNGIRGGGNKGGRYMNDMQYGQGYRGKWN